MVLRPSGIIFVNNDLTENVRKMLIKQLHINEVIDGYVFDDRILANPDYPNVIRQLDLRLMVVRPYTELENRDLADLAIFCSHGLAAVLKNNFGPPAQTFPIKHLTWPQLGKFT